MSAAANVTTETMTNATRIYRKNECRVSTTHRRTASETVLVGGAHTTNCAKHRRPAAFGAAAYHAISDSSNSQRA